jgi:hypothetical protein
MKAMPDDEKQAWTEAGQPEIAGDYTIPLFTGPVEAERDALRELVACRLYGDQFRQLTRGMNAHAAEDAANDYGLRWGAAWKRAISIVASRDAAMAQGVKS